MNMILFSYWLQMQFHLEAKMMKEFHHVNIIQLLGVCTAVEPVYLIMELMLHGDLKNLLLIRRHLCGTGETVSRTNESLSLLSHRAHQLL